MERDYEAALRRARDFANEGFRGTTTVTLKPMFEATVLETMGRSTEARPLWERSRELLTRELHRVPEDARLHSAMGLTLAYLGYREEAIEHGRHATELYPASLDAFHGPYYERHLAEIYTVLGEQDAAGA